MLETSASVHQLLAEAEHIMVRVQQIVKRQFYVSKSDLSQSIRNRRHMSKNTRNIVVLPAKDVACQKCRDKAGRIASQAAVQTRALAHIAIRLVKILSVFFPAS
jgi:hypothetical protein